MPKESVPLQTFYLPVLVLKENMNYANADLINKTTKANLLYKLVRFQSHRKDLRSTKFADIQALPDLEKPRKQWRYHLSHDDL
mmetsp:Transcript_18352/g.26664  ORF Transcript_18352/g.26664 Transcript_18352/m.26664 type:complete len:83 (-) Transcript_18352:1515-1763(-)